MTKEEHRKQHENEKFRSVVPKNVKFGDFFAPKHAKLNSQFAHSKKGHTHAHRMQVSKEFLNTHRTHANVHARVHVQIQFRNSQFAI